MLDIHSFIHFVKNKYVLTRFLFVQIFEVETIREKNVGGGGGGGGGW